MALNGSVAIVDDEPGVLRTYELLFKRRKISLAFTALDGPEAIEKLKKANLRPSVVVIDYRLPTMNGLELMREVLAIEPGIKIIFISGDDSVREKSIDAGAAVFLKKPTSIKVITETVTNLLKT